ncbi:MAG TPA: lamin tail domain-containing protein [Longimicrobium sp.]|nr:lamin tail domain-containing protein [Longimicrobium sp.]
MPKLRLHAALPLAVLFVLSACSEGFKSPTGPSPSAPEAPSFAISALAGKLVINELMIDPSAVTDANGEWLEIHNRADTAVNLQGFILAGNSDSNHTISSSVPIPSRGYAVLAKNGTSGTNGGVTVNYVYGTMNLANGSDWVALRDAAGASVDSVAWSTTVPAGSSRGVTDPDSDNLALSGSNWHTSAVAYGGGDNGTPGAQNDGRRSPLTVRMLDVGQGDALYITNGLSKVVLDGGPSTTDIAGVISEFGLDHGRIDYMFLTHPHADHLAGLREFFKASHDIDITYFFENKDTYSGSTLASLRDSINARVGRGELIYRDTDDPCTTGAAICTILLDGGARMHVLKPKPTDSNPNNRSFAMKLVGPDSASFTMWAAGDAEHAAIIYFDSTANYDVSPGMNVNVLKADHHGSCNGISTRLLNLTTPDYVFMGVSSTNTYGHVHNQTKTLLSGLSIPWLRTDENGRITFTTPGTVGGGYSVSYATGSASENGSADATSVDADCASL